MRDGYWVLDGHTPVPADSVKEWSQAFRRDNRTVARTEIGEARVSTVFLGIDYSRGKGPPLLFETMILGGPENEYVTRSSTWKEAEQQHEEACALVRAKQQ